MTSMTDQPEINPEQWVDEYGTYLYKYALMRLRDPSTAHDVVQETFLAALKGVDRYDGRVDIKYWLRGILRNKVVDHFRKSTREVPVEDEGLEALQNKFSQKAFGIPTSKPQPWQFDVHNDLDRDAFWEVFEQCMQKLKGLTREAFAMKMLEEMDTREICKILEIEPNHLWVLLHRARGALKQCLETMWAKKA